MIVGAAHAVARHMHAAGRFDHHGMFGRAAAHTSEWLNG